MNLSPFETLSGRVVVGDEGVAGAEVHLRYSIPVRATHRILGDYAKHTRRIPVELLPQVDQRVTTDADGRFELGLDRRAGADPYVIVRSADGTLEITEQVRGQGELVCDLLRP